MNKLGFITPSGLKQLHLYRYQSATYTWLDHALQPYWNYVLIFVPLTIAPNLLTLIGWLLLLSATVIILTYDFTFK
jgi:ethanolaminephosphotransferase